MTSNQQCLVSGHKEIRPMLERLYHRYNRRSFIKPDPLQFVYNYTEPADREIVGFLAADLAYGRVAQIERSLKNLFGRMGESPYKFVLNFSETYREKLRSFKHRFTTGDDISDLLSVLRQILNKYGSIEKFFIEDYKANEKNVVPALVRFCDKLCAIHARNNGGKVTTGLKYLLASPSRGSASKRLNLFLRWMVRRDDVDLGLWKGVDKSKLVVPIDVHMSRLCRILGLYKYKAVSLSAALQITESLAKIEPSDPAKYDFALSRIGILEDCDGKYRPRCEECELFELCCGLWDGYET
jgi:uncharacterized protein (TIGR02757 family)